MPQPSDHPPVLVKVVRSDLTVECMRAAFRGLSADSGVISWKRGWHRLLRLRDWNDEQDPEEAVSASSE